MGDLAKSRKCLPGAMPKCWKMREKCHFAKKNEKNSGNAPGWFLRFLMVLDRFWWFLSIKTCKFMIFQWDLSKINGFWSRFCAFGMISGETWIFFKNFFAVKKNLFFYETFLFCVSMHFLMLSVALFPKNCNFQWFSTNSLLWHAVFFDDFSFDSKYQHVRVRNWWKIIENHNFSEKGPR